MELRKLIYTFYVDYGNINTMATPISLQHHRPPLSSHDIPNNYSISIQVQTYPCLVSLEKCSTLSELQQIHAQMLRTGLFFDPYSASNIVAFSALQLQDSGSLHYARQVFSQISNPTTYTCNSLIRGYTNNNLHYQAIVFYREMIVQGLVPDRFTFPSLFKSCVDLSEGRQLHCHSTKFGFASDSYVQNTLMTLYSSCGCLVSTERLFYKMDDKSVVSWATIIGAYVQWDQPGEAIKIFERMGSENVKPNEITLVNVLASCARAGDLGTTKRVHEYVDENGFGFHVVLNTALMNAYSKCGCVTLARDLFDRMPHTQNNLYCWNVLIKGYVDDSEYEEALLLFR
ncbi:pentatricopeptide repeat-containing protein At2g29760, chloroplastic-like [Pistacia vera]|uniref:pentatricopeptide repeat-containing protein At2g29760, chloroplastic-like n=1 Tax=Pistacia vera TaxID=55513 RepID=UPI001263D4FC|nr:pentatricopeptide repeat-containing protein At2g29760, chloroplastic-like [Pistacia vera]